MNKLFLFSNLLQDEGCYCLQLEPSGAISLAGSFRPYAEIRPLAETCETIIVESTVNASIFTLDLPWLAERKARQAIPYALEDKLAQPVELLHVAFDKKFYSNNQYLLAIISKERIRYITNKLIEHGIDFSAITLDWFALAPNESLNIENVLLINDEQFKGALTSELASLYGKDNNLSSLNDKETASPFFADDAYVWMAKRLTEGKFINLCQGEMEHGHQRDTLKKKLKIIGALFVLWLLVVIGTNAFNLYIVQKKNHQLDEQIASTYRQFFPNAKQIISPKFRIEQLIKKSTDEEQNQFWFLINQFAKTFNPEKYTLEQLRFQNKTLTINLLSPDFANLEQLENQLKQLHINVKQIQAATREKQVAATLELS